MIFFVLLRDELSFYDVLLCLSFFSVFQDSTFAKLPDRNVDYLVAEGNYTNVNY